MDFQLLFAWVQNRPLRVSSRHFTSVRSTGGYAVLGSRSLRFFLNLSERPKEISATRYSGSGFLARLDGIHGYETSIVPLEAKSRTVVNKRKSDNAVEAARCLYPSRQILRKLKMEELVLFHNCQASCTPSHRNQLSTSRFDLCGIRRKVFPNEPDRIFGVIANIRLKADRTCTKLSA